MTETADHHDDIATELEAMRHAWQVGYRTAASAATDLRTIATTLTQLRTLPMPQLPDSDPSCWSRPTLPTMPFPVETVEHHFNVLAGLVTAVAACYDDHATALTAALTNLENLALDGLVDHLRASLVPGYDAGIANTVLARLSAAGGHRIVCLWGYLDDHGYGDDADLYILSPGGEALHYISDDLLAWLTTDAHDPEHPAHPGHPHTWPNGTVNDFGYTDLATTTDDHRHNIAHHDHR